MQSKSKICSRVLFLIFRSTFGIAKISSSGVQSSAETATNDDEPKETLDPVLAALLAADDQGDDDDEAIRNLQLLIFEVNIGRLHFFIDHNSIIKRLSDCE